MHNLREKLLSAGFVTEAQRTQVETTEKQKVSAKRGNRGPKRGRRSGPAGREVEAADPKLAPAMRAIDEHRIRGDVRGAEEFQFEARDGQVRKMLVTKEISHGLQSGRMAIVEWGDATRHIVVGRAALTKVQAIDPQIIRFCNAEGVTS